MTYRRGVPPSRHPLRLLLVLVAGATATAALALVARDADQGHQRSVLERRAEEAAGTISDLLPLVQIPMTAAVAVARETGGDAAAVSRVIDPLPSEDGLVRTAALWRREASGWLRVAVAGVPSTLVRIRADERQAALDRAPVDGVGLIDLTDHERRAVGVTLVEEVDDGETSAYLVYLELTLPDRPSELDVLGRSFEELDYLAYLGSEPDRDKVLLGSVDALPSQGLRAEVVVPFADDELLVVFSPRRRLSSDISAALPWLIVVVGGVLTIGAAYVVGRLQAAGLRSARRAQRNLDLYRSERETAQVLQRSLLPRSLPTDPRFDAVHCYEAGSDELLVGGDWYDLVAVGPDVVVLSIGDVSGHGVDASTVMGRLRWGARAYAQQGDGPVEILTKLNALLDVTEDGHIATMLCARLDLGTGEIELANAGHPPLIVVEEGASARVVEGAPGPPIGAIAEPDYETEHDRCGPGSRLLAYTDGLFERRGETCDVGLARLVTTVEATRHLPLDDALDAVVARMDVRGVQDDTAALSLEVRRTPAISEPAPGRP